MMATRSPPPRWFFCQMCRHPLEIAGLEGSAEKSAVEMPRPGMAPSQASTSMLGSGSILNSSRMDQSFVVLPKQRGASPGAQLLPPKPRQQESPARVASGAQASTPSQGGANQGGVGLGGAARMMEESFVVLPSSAASIYRHEGGGESGGGAWGGGVGPGLASNASLDARIRALTKVFEVASQQTQVDQPVCVECTRSLCEELEAQTNEAEREIAGYEACLARLEGDPLESISEPDFARIVKEAEEEERVLLAHLEQLEGQRAEAAAQLQELEQKANELSDAEQRYWHDFNDFKLQLAAHQEERDAVCTRIEGTAAQLEMLKRTNVLTDAFPIWHDGEFGTINNFRLGRLPNVPVEWDEINAAWGQACLLLYTMAQLCKFNFSFRILPMGSYPRIADNKNTYDLYGPVNLFWSTRYDKAMVLFLACLQEFAEFAHSRDLAAEVPKEKCFVLPYKIEGDKVNGFTIKQSFNRDERWTKALKYTLCDLKWALVWLINNASAHPYSPKAATSPQHPSAHTRTSLVLSSTSQK